MPGPSGGPSPLSTGRGACTRASLGEDTAAEEHDREPDHGKDRRSPSVSKREEKAREEESSKDRANGNVERPLPGKVDPPGERAEQNIARVFRIGSPATRARTSGWNPVIGSYREKELSIRAKSE